MYKKLFGEIDGVIVLVAHSPMQRAGDMAYPFAQESSFFWLTKIDAPYWRIVIECQRQKSWLIAPDVKEQDRLFDGELDHDTARRLSSVNDVLSAYDGKNLLNDLAEKYETVYTLGVDKHQEHANFIKNPATTQLHQELEQNFKKVEDCRPILNSLRAVKHTDEIQNMRHAVHVTADGFTKVRKIVDQLSYEYEVEAELTHSFRFSGTMGHAYDPIVASGINACTLHYTNNNDRLPENGLILIDAGARVNGYCADITRTYAIGTPTARQKAVHGAVEKAHHAIIALLGPNKSVKEYHEEVDAIMIEALRSLDLYKKPSDYRKYFPHAISHGLGIDVHDALGNPTHFKPGMVLTVEPGIYIPEEGIGVRIEDDILITDEGHENLSGHLSTAL